MYAIRSYYGNLINESNYNNVMFVSPQVSSEIQDISNYKDIINHLWIVGPEYNGHGEFDAVITSYSIHYTKLYGMK